MIHILVLILKIIGWVFLGILGLVLGILLFVLFSAIRYQIDGSKNGKPEGKVKITWLLWIISATVHYRDNLSVQVKLLGKTVWKMGGKEKASDSVSEKPSEPANPMGAPESEGIYLLQTDEEFPDEDLPFMPNAESADSGSTDSALVDFSSSDSSSIDSASVDSVSGKEESVSTDTDTGKKKRQKKKKAKKRKKLKAKKRRRKSSEENHLEELPEEQAGELPGEPTEFEKEESEESSNSGLYEWQKGIEKIKNKLLAFVNRINERILSIIQKVRFSIQSVCGKLKQVEEKISWAKEKWDMVQEYIANPANQKSAKLILRQVKKILIHPLPKKGSAVITFGLEEPYQMGQVLSAAAFIYPFVHKHLTLYPVFDRKILEGEVHIRGRIRLGILLGYVLRLLLDGNIRKQLWNLIRSSKKPKKKKFKQAAGES